MGILANKSRSNIVAFTEYARRVHCLTSQDKRDISDNRKLAEAAGYDRLIIHVMEPWDEIESADYVCAHWVGESWSRWGFARANAGVFAWNTISSKDMGVFPTMAEALQQVLCLRGIAESPAKLGCGGQLRFQ